jgi:hypothetical protein
MVRLGLSAGVLVFAGLPLAGAVAQTRVILDPHKAVYDLRLDNDVPSKSVEGARGRIAFDFTGDACEGYALTFRQVTELQSSEIGTRTIDSRQTSFEDGAAASFRFKSESTMTGAKSDLVDGSVQRVDGQYRVKVDKPKPATSTLSSSVMFPSGQVKAIIAAAKAGQTTFAVQLFDGSEDGARVYDTLAVIGRQLEKGPSASLEEPLRRPEFEKMARWPVTISYFKQGASEATPSYRVAFDLYENGVTGAVRMHYSDFSLTATLTRLDLLARSACEK